MTGSQSLRVRRALHAAATVSWQALIVLLAVVVVGYAVGQLWDAVLPMVLALLLSSLVWPLARWLRARRWPPSLAALTVTLLTLVVVIGGITLVVVPSVSQAEEVATGVQEGIQSLQEWLQGPPLNLADDELGSVVDDGLAYLQENAGDLASAVLGGAGALGGGLIVMALVLVLMFLYLKDGPRFVPWLARQTGPQAAVHVTELATRGYNTISAFMRAQTVVGLVDAVFIGIGLLIVGVPLVLPLAVLTFLGAFVPIIGAFVAGAFAVLIALVSNGLTDALIVLGIIIVVQQVEGNVLEPILQSKSLHLHPAAVILVVIAGSGLAGVIGALLAVPIAALIAVIWRYVREHLDRTDTPPPAP